MALWLAPWSDSALVPQVPQSGSDRPHSMEVRIHPPPVGCLMICCSSSHCSSWSTLMVCHYPHQPVHHILPAPLPCAPAQRSSKHHYMTFYEWHTVRSWCDLSFVGTKGGYGAASWHHHHHHGNCVVYTDSGTSVPCQNLVWGHENHESHPSVQHGAHSSLQTPPVHPETLCDLWCQKLSWAGALSGSSTCINIYTLISIRSSKLRKG